MDDLFFEQRSQKKTRFADFRFSRHLYGDACVIRVDDATPVLVFGRDDVEYEVPKRVAALEKAGYERVAKKTLPDIQTPPVIEAITGHRVPARYEKFLAEGSHPSGTVDGITNFADGIPIVFDDPVVPFWLKHFGWNKRAPNAIPIALVEEGRALSIDAKTGAIYVYDDSASEPHVLVYDSLDELLENVTVPNKKKTKKKKRR